MTQNISIAFAEENFKIPREAIHNLGNISGSIELNSIPANIITATVTGNITFTFTESVFTNTAYARVITLKLTNGGNFTITWPTSIKWSDNTAPTLASNGDNILNLISFDNEVTWYGILPF